MKQLLTVDNDEAPDELGFAFFGEIPEVRIAELVGGVSIEDILRRHLVEARVKVVVVGVGTLRIAETRKYNVVVRYKMLFYTIVQFSNAVF